MPKLHCWFANDTRPYVYQFMNMILNNWNDVQLRYFIKKISSRTKIKKNIWKPIYMLRVSTKCSPYIYAGSAERGYRDNISVSLDGALF